MTLATRIGVMNQGEIAMIGEPTDIYEYPNSRFVASFIGSANMVEGVVTEDEPDHVRIRSAELGCDIYVGHGVDCAPDQILWWAIRPEKMHLSREKPEETFGANVTKGVVEDIAYLGDMSLYQVRARQRQAHPRQPDQLGARQPRRHHLGRAGLHHLGRQVPARC